MFFFGGGGGRGARPTLTVYLSIAYQRPIHIPYTHTHSLWSSCGSTPSARTP